MPRFESENQVQRQVQNNANIQVQQNVQEQQNIQINQNAQADQNAQINLNGAVNLLENRDVFDRPGREMMDIINGEEQADDVAIRQRRDIAERFAHEPEEQANAHQAGVRRNVRRNNVFQGLEHQVGITDVDANITMKKGSILSKYHPVRRGEKTEDDRIGTYIKKAPEKYKKRLDSSKGVSPVAQTFNMSVAINQIMNVQAIAGSEHMNDILVDVGVLQEQLKDLQRMFATEKYYNSEGYFDYRIVYENEEFSFTAIDAIADKVLSIRRKLGSYIKRNSGMFHANSKKGAARLKAAKDLRNLIDYELVENLENVIQIAIGNKPATLSAAEGWVDLNQNDFESDDFVVINHAEHQLNNEAPQRMLEIEIEPQQEGNDLVEAEGVSYSRKLVDEINNVALFTAEQLSRVTEDEKNSVAELIAREVTVEESEKFAAEQLQREHNIELKIGSRKPTIKAQLKRLGIVVSGDGDFNRMFRELIGGSSDKTTMAVENQLLTALEAGDFDTIKAYAIQVRDELSKMPTDLESYKTMDYESLKRIGYMGFMFDVLRKSRVLFPENESDAILDKIAGAKAEIAAGIRRIIDTQVVKLGRSHEKFDIDLPLYLQSSERKQEYKEGSIRLGISQCLGNGIAALRDLRVQLEANEEQWNRYGKYYESQEYTSNRDARLRPVGNVNIEELSGQLTDYMEQERSQKLSFFNRKLENLSNKQGQSDRFYALCNLCKEAEAADKNLPHLEKEKFFDRLAIELSKYIETTGNSENKLEAVLLRQDLLRYMKENGVLPVKYELNIAAKNKTISADKAPKLDKYEQSALNQLVLNKSAIGIGIITLVPDFHIVYLRVVTLAKYEKSRAFKEMYANKAYLIEELDKFFEAKEMDVEGMSMREKYSRQREVRMEDLARLEDQCTEYLDDCEDESKREIVTAYKAKVNELYRKFFDQMNEERERIAQMEARRAAQAAGQANG